MSRFSSIRQPENDRYIQICEWQIKFCNDNHCAALLLAFFIGWHDWKIRNDQYYRRANDIAEMHGDARLNNENAYLFFSTEDLIEGCMGFYGKNAVNEALQLLISLNVITVHKNPNPRYHFDKTKYFQFYPNVCNQWIEVNCSLSSQEPKFNSQPVDSSDTPKRDDRYAKNKQRSAENNQPTTEKGRYITNTTNNTTTNNQSIQSMDDNELFCSQKQKINSQPVQTRTNNDGKTKEIINALIAKGLSAEKCSYPDIVPAITKLHESGATVAMFVDAYDIAAQKTNRGFGVSYVLKVVESLLTKSQQTISPSQQYSQSSNCDRQTKSDKSLTPDPVYKSDFKNAMSWAGDILGDLEN